MAASRVSNPIQQSTADNFAPTNETVEAGAFVEKNQRNIF
jgi:hypothetical protein